MTSRFASALSPRVASLPLTVTFPSSIIRSQLRRDPSPAAARIFWRRSSLRGGTASGGASNAEPSNAAPSNAVRGSVTGLRDGSTLGIGDLINVVGKERGERRQLVHAVQAEFLQEQ